MVYNDITIFRFILYTAWHCIFFNQNYSNSNEDMILALAGQFKQLSPEPEKFSRDLALTVFLHP